MVLTAAEAEDDMLAAVEAGALGYLAKTSPHEDFLAAIRCVAQGGAWPPPNITHRLLTRRKPAPASFQESLTRREREVLALIARGLSNRHISQSLSIAEITVRTHVSHIFGKLGVRNRVEAALHALRSGRADLPGS